MRLFRKKISEFNIAHAYVGSVSDATKDGWPKFYAFLRGDDHYRTLEAEDEINASRDFSLAAMAYHMMPLRNLFAPDEAHRLRRYVLSIVKSSDNGEYYVREIEAYSAAWDDALKDSDDPRDAASAIAGRLLVSWFGTQLREFTCRVGDRQTDIIHPILVTHVDLYLLGLLGRSGFWKWAKEQYRIVESDGNLPEWLISAE